MGIQYKFRLFLAALCGLLIAGFQNCSDHAFSDDFLNNLHCTLESPCENTNGTFTAVESFSYGPISNAVDILIIDDNSGSMAVEQNKLGQRLQNLLSKLSSFDWRLGVTSADVCPPVGGGSRCFNSVGAYVTGAQGRFLKPNGGVSGFNEAPFFFTKAQYDANPSSTRTTFKNTVKRPEEGSGAERGIFAANLAIEGKDTFNQGFFRQESTLAMLLLSDEDELSNGTNLEEKDLPQTLLNTVSTLFGGNKAFVFNSIIVDPGASDGSRPQDTACHTQQEAQNWQSFYGTIYRDLTELTGGIVRSICDNDYSEGLENISDKIVNTHQAPTIILKNVPVTMPTLDFINGPAVTYSWTPGSPVIKLDSRPTSQTTLHITYDFAQ